MLDIKHLEHVKGMIVDGLKMELKETILASYSISDQLNASGTEATTIRTGIAAILATGHAKRDAVIAATTFEELNAIIPMAEEE